MAAEPRRGEVWLAELGATRGHEQAGRRPVVVLSADAYNCSAAGLLVVLPMTTAWRGVPLHVQVAPPEGGLKHPTTILCDAIRSISRDRLVERWGRLGDEPMAQIEERVRVLLVL